MSVQSSHTKESDGRSYSGCRLIEHKNMSEYQSMCNDCGKKTYGKVKRDAGAITIALRKCPVCGKKKGIIPATDWRYMHMDNPTAEDWD